MCIDILNTMNIRYKLELSWKKIDRNKPVCLFFCKCTRFLCKQILESQEKKRAPIKSSAKKGIK